MNGDSNFNLHRRKTSKDADENTPKPRIRVCSTPNGQLSQLAPAPLERQPHHHHRSPSVSAFAPPLPSPLSASALSSVTTPTTHIFPSSASAPPDTPTYPTATSPISPSFHPFPLVAQAQPQAQPHSTRRHARMHSRNLSIFFPRPGSLPHTVEEHENGGGGGEGEAPVSDIPPAGPTVSWRPGGRRPMSLSSPELHPPATPLGVGFTFGSRPPRTLSSVSAAELPIPPPMTTTTTTSSSSSSMTARRGHHHKHSLSHNFFSFLEPGANVGVGVDVDVDVDGVGGGGGGGGGSEELRTVPTPTLVSPWTRVPSQGCGEDTSPTDDEGSSSSKKASLVPSPSYSSSPLGLAPDEASAGDGASVVGVGQFVVGAWMWVVGQQVGSLACTGLGYWVVFDAIGVGIGRIVPQWLSARSGKEGEKERVRRPFGNARTETVLMFAQVVYLMFSAVYVCKETVEHVLLSAGPSGGGEKHHHHYHLLDDDGSSGIHFPMFLLLITFLSLTSTAFLYDNHAQLLNVTHVRIPSFRVLLRSVLTATKWTYHDARPTTRTGLVLSNPYIASPLFFCSSILFVAQCIPSSQHEAFDLILAAVIAGVTFNVAYRACAVLGTVLLQTAPPRRFSGGRMEMFLRAMKEVERHPQVVHLPPPHIWQLAAAGLEYPGGGGNGEKMQDGGRTPMERLVVTVELHVRREMGDEEVLRLTRWAWERCMLALGGGVRWEEKWSGAVGRGEGPEVTVGVVRG
ncbi:hypothetical protein APHAL10511_005527 [Amanita phalloides]|nr:hypothetical protein APHAL10511_005527 [Amanita phalloides]